MNRRKTLLNKLTSKVAIPGLALGVSLASLGITACPQMFTDPINPPKITSNPITEVREGKPYRYQVRATDENVDTLVCRLNESPRWLSEQNCIISGKARLVDKTEKYNVTVSVLDEKGSSDSQSYQLTVKDVAVTQGNNPPVITSEPKKEVNKEQTYNYTIRATDADDDPLTCSLTKNPPWLSEIQECLISGTAPPVTQDTNYNVEVSVTDGIDSDSQAYPLTVKDATSTPSSNHAPVITSSPSTEVNEEQTYNYTIEATDADNDNITCALTQSQSPSWLSETRECVISGTAPPVTQDNNYNVEVSVTDNKVEEPVKQTYTLTVKDTTDISGTLQNSETDTAATGEVRAYKEQSDGTYRLLDSTTTDSNGNFSLQFDGSVSDFELQARLMDGTTKESYVRTVSLPGEDEPALIVRAVPYTGLVASCSTPMASCISYDDFKTFFKEINTGSVYVGTPPTGEWVSGRIQKWNLNNLQGIEILLNNPSGSMHGSFTTQQQDYIKTRIIADDDIELMFNGMDLESKVQIDTATTTASEMHYTLESNFNGNNITAVSADTGWIVVVPMDNLQAGGEAEPAINNQGYITSGGVGINTSTQADGVLFQSGSKTISHEFGHVTYAPDGTDGAGHTYKLYTDQSLMSNRTRSNSTAIPKPGFADKKLLKVLNTFPAGTPHDDLFRTEYHD